MWITFWLSSSLFLLFLLFLLIPVALFNHVINGLLQSVWKKREEIYNIKKCVCVCVLT